MARYLFLTWNGAGNQPPAVALAQNLRRRGHYVTFAGYENQRDYFAGRGFRFVLVEGAAAAWRDDVPDRMFAIKMQTAWASPDHLKDVPRLISREQPDALVVDCMMFGALAAVELANLSTFVLVHSAPGALMPPNGAFERHFREPVNALRSEAGLPRLADVWDAWAPFPALCNSIPELDPLSVQVPDSVIYFGPFLEDAPTPRSTLPWTLPDGPLVLVSFSTGPYWDQRSRIERTLKALAEQNCRVLVTAGSVNPATLTIPGNAMVVRHLPHAAVLPHAALTITHAGHGTVIASLTHGVPLLCLPNNVADQPILARRLEQLGAGLTLDGDNSKPCEISTAVRQLLNDDSYAAGARRLGAIISEAPGMPAAIQLLERKIRPLEFRNA